MTVTTPIDLRDLYEFVKQARKTGAPWDARVDARVNEIGAHWTIDRFGPQTPAEGA